MPLRRLLGAVLLGTGLVLLGAAGCAQLGYTNRILSRVPSPTNTAVLAVCQEVPVFDGPDYEIRLERSDGALIRRLYRIGDGDPCSEVAWSPDGGTLAVLSGHVARLRFVDVAWALDHPSTTTHYWSWRQVDLSTADRRAQGRSLRFVGPLEVELQLSTAGAPTRFEIPLPVVAGH